MLDRLGTCGIIALEENEIKSEHVKTFREGLQNTWKQLKT